MPKAAEALSSLKPLTSLRFFAALAVFCSHLDFFKKYETLDWVHAHVFNEGYLGVTFFFVLSGFILTYNYYERLPGLQWREVRKFYVARFARVYPVHFLTFFVAIPLLFPAVLKEPLQAILLGIPNLLLLQSYFPMEGVYYSLNAPSWSLCNEFFFYAVLPFILFGLSRWLPAKRRALAGFAFGVWTFTFFFVWMFRDAPIGHWLFYIAPPFRLLDFMLGVVIGLIYLKTPKPRWRASTWTLLELASVAGLIGLIAYSGHIHQSYRYGVYYMPLFGVMVFLFACQEGWLSRLLSHDFCILLGEMSFSFYMFHQLVLRYIYKISHYQWGYEKMPVTTALLAFIVSLVLSYLCFEYYEKRTRDTLKRKL